MGDPARGGAPRPRVQLLHGGRLPARPALEGAAGQSVEAFADAHLFALLGIEGAAWQRSATGQVQNGGGLSLRSRDLLALPQLYADGGSWSGTRVVPEAWVDASMQPQVAFEGPDGEPFAYGYLWWIHDFDVGGTRVPTHVMAGAGGNMVAVVPSLDMVVAITSENFYQRGAHALTYRVLTEHVREAARPGDRR